MHRLILLLLLVPTVALAGGHQPHPHRGVFAPITSDPGAVELTPEETARMEAGRLVQKMKQSDDSGWGSAVQLVDAPARVVWDTILSYDRYVDWVDNVKSCSVYRRDGDTLWVGMTSGIPGFSFDVYTRNVVKRDEGWMAWTLDYDRTSDVYDMVGSWRVTEVSARRTRLDYSTRMKVRGVPNFVVKSLTKSSLESGTAWVKEQAEAAVR